jgi:hypothetical protein
MLTYADVCAACVLFAAYVVVDKAAGAMSSKKKDHGHGEAHH